MKWYFLALLIWFAEILMCATILLIPVCIYLRDNDDWFDSPFNEARIANILE